MNISYDSYRVFYYAAKYKSFSRAAAALYNNQPNVTRIIKRLESELHCALFFRSSLGVRLTPEENYTVELQAVDDAPMPSENVLEISGSGKAFFSPIQYTTPGIYYYTITQQSGTHKRGHYDQTVYYVKVSVTNGENGNLETVIAAHTDADMTDAKCDITFTNYYKPIKKTSESTTETIPTTKRKPETKPGNKTSIKKSKNKVKTGDNSNATLFAILLLVSGTGLLIIAISCYREKYHK